MQTPNEGPDQGPSHPLVQIRDFPKTETVLSVNTDNQGGRREGRRQEVGREGTDLSMELPGAFLPRALPAAPLGLQQQQGLHACARMYTYGINLKHTVHPASHPAD